MAHGRHTRVLVITDRAAATPALLDTIRGRAARGPAEFRVLVPNPGLADWHPTHPELGEKVVEAQHVLAQALPLIEEAAGHAVEGFVSTRHDPMDVIEETLLEQPFDEIILAMEPHPIDRAESWLHVDLPHRAAHLGVPVTTVTRQHRADTPRTDSAG